MSLESTIIGIIPVVLIAAFIIVLVYHARNHDLDMKQAIPGLVVVMVGLLIATSLIGTTFEDEWDGWSYDGTTDTLVIEGTMPVFSKDARPWDGKDIERIYVETGASVTAGAMRSVSPVYIEIASGATVDQGAFPFSLQEWDGSPAQDVTGKAFYAFDGAGQPMTRTVPYGSIAHSGDQVTGLSDWTAPAQWNLSIPKIAPDGTELKRQTTSLFESTSGLTRVAIDTEIVSYHVFKSCADLETVRGDAVTIGQGTFEECSALISADFPNATSIDIGAFKSSALASAEFPKVTTVGSSAFNSAPITDAIFPEAKTIASWAFNTCTSLVSVYLPKAESIGNNAFSGVTAIASVTLGSSLTEVTGAFPNWTFYASDGTTQLDKTSAAALAGKTFRGTAAALVELAPGQLTLSPQQFQQVQLHTQELQQQELDIQPLPFQPTVQTQDQEPVSA